ncbi:hypothetical protein ABUW04_21910 [Streptacidiphilus sp. N1-10]|uniref:Secreted protein n=1 Tax=Streptacidiphilus jeojiensis TaxID=3229225 RepID=A0ABV6XRL1_9ACTN
MVFIIVVGVLVGLAFLNFIVKSIVRAGRQTRPYADTRRTRGVWEDGTTPYGIDTAVPPHGGHHGGGHHHGGHHQHHDIGSTPTHTSHDMGGGGHHHG